MNMLLDWVRWHFTKPDRLAEEIIWCDEPSSHESYWPAVSYFTSPYLLICLSPIVHILSCSQHVLSWDIHIFSPTPF